MILRTLPLLALFGCAPKTPHSFTYEGSEGPDHWSDLSAAWSACGDGVYQSPIDLHQAATRDVAPLDIQWSPARFDMVDTGHAVEVIHAGAGRILLGDRTYELLQWHVHDPSEHTVDGEHAALELHFVHQDGRGDYAVVGVLVDEGEALAAAEPLVQHLAGLRRDGTEEVRPHLMIDPSDFLPDGMARYQYFGSLTTPPCTERVYWSVMATRLTMSAAQIAAISHRHVGNNRPVQPRPDWCLMSRDQGGE